MKTTLLDANFPRDAEGRTYHVGTKSGEVANRIITVGDYTRARRIAKSFDGGRAVFEHESHRKFLTLTGTYKGTPITVVAIGMGFSVVDFFVRECRAVVQGDMIIVRLGSCGSMSNSAPIGSVVVPYLSVGVTRNYDHYFASDEEKKNSYGYHITRALPCDKEVHDSLLRCLLNTLPAPPSATRDSEHKNSNSFTPQAIGNIFNASADSFYSSQGRQTTSFADENEGLIGELRRIHPQVQTFEMETFLLNHLARSANESADTKSGKSGQMRTGAAQMVFANRETKDFITPDQVEMLEEWGGKAVCQALTEVDIPQQRLHGDGVWNQEGS